MLQYSGSRRNSMSGTRGGRQAATSWQAVRGAAASQPQHCLCPSCTPSHPPSPPPPSALRSSAHPLRCWPAPAPCCTPAQTVCAQRLPACRWGAPPPAASGAAPAQPPAPPAAPCRTKSPEPEQQPESGGRSAGCTPAGASALNLRQLSLCCAHASDNTAAAGQPPAR